jgi:4-hydroxy-tetrahydrodipicolinate synthase
MYNSTCWYVFMVDHSVQTLNSVSFARVQIGSGVDGLIIGGTTGEGQLMSWDEHIMLIAHTVNK